MKKLSIIMPVYNPRKYLQYALESVEKQKFPLGDLELIAVDDCSTDDSLNKLENYKIRSPFSMKVIRSKEHSGASAARNAGVRVSGGELLLFFDSDDLLHEECVSKCVEAFDKTKDAGFVYTNHSAIKPETIFPPQDEDIIYVKEKPNFEMNHFLEGAYNYVGHVKVVRRNLNLPFDESMPYSEDADWIVRLGLSEIKFKHIPESLYYWRRGIQSLTSKHSEKVRRALHNKAFRKEK